jgi:hypothetical protein
MAPLKFLVIPAAVLAAAAELKGGSQVLYQRLPTSAVLHNYIDVVGIMECAIVLAAEGQPAHSSRFVACSSAQRRANAVEYACAEAYARCSLPFKISQ